MSDSPENPALENSYVLPLTEGTASKYPIEGAPTDSGSVLDGAKEQVPDPGPTATGRFSSLFQKAKESAAAVVSSVGTSVRRISETHEPQPREAHEQAAPEVKGPTPPSALEVGKGTELGEDASSTAASAGFANAAAAAPTKISMLQEAATDLGKKTYAISSSYYSAAAATVRRLTAARRTITAISKHNPPVPHFVVSVCTYISASGCGRPGMFMVDEDTMLEAEVLCLKMDTGLLLLPADVVPNLAAAALLHFLASLEEPLLVTKLLPKWVAAGALGDDDRLAAIKALLTMLPTPNLATLSLIMETCHRLTSSACGTAKAADLAKSLVPAMLWGEARTLALDPPPVATASMTDAVVSPLLSLKARAGSLIRQGSKGLDQMGAGADPAVQSGNELADGGSLAGGAKVEGSEEESKDAKAAADVVAADVDAAGAAAGAVGSPADMAAHDVSKAVADMEAADDADVSKGPGCKLHLAGAQLEAVVCVLERCVSDFPQLFLPAPPANPAF